MNIVKDIQDRITKRALETSNPCKLYKTEAMAERYADKLAAQAAEHFDTARPANYIIVHIARFDRFAIAFDINELVNRHDAKGGFVGIFAAAGHFSY